MNVPTEWYKHKPQASTDIGDINVMWDMTIRTDRYTRHNKPDIIIHDKKSKSCQIIDVAIPLDQNVNMKIAEKLTKYKPLQVELTQMYGLKKVEIIPIVIGALGTVTQSLPEYTNKISERIDLQNMIKTTLIGTAHIVREFLT